MEELWSILSRTAADQVAKETFIVRYCNLRYRTTEKFIAQWKFKTRCCASYLEGYEFNLRPACPVVLLGFPLSLQADIGVVLHILRQGRFDPGYVVYLTMLYQSCVRVFVSDDLKRPVCPSA